VHDETNRDAWIAVRKTLLPRIRGLAVVMDGPPDPLTRIAHDDGKTMFDIRSDLVLDGYWTDEITNTSDRL